MDGRDWYCVNAEGELTASSATADFERLFRLDVDAAELERDLILAGPELEPYIQALSGLRSMQPQDAVEAFFGFLCSANNNLARIVPMVWKLGSYGGPVSAPFPQASQFPEPEAIAAIPETELRDAGFGYRAATIPKAAAQVVERGGRPWIESLRHVPYQEARRELLGISGIGPKLADCICLFALHHRTAVPIDTHIWQQLTRLYHPDWHGTNLTEKKYSYAANAFRDRFGENAGWAHQYLFFDNVLHGRERRKA